MIYLKSNEFFRGPDSVVTTELRTPQDSFPEHAHGFEELMIVSAGKGTHVINDVPMPLSKNRVCFVRREDRHLFENVDNLHLSNILFDRSHPALDACLQKYIPQQAEQSSWFLSESSSRYIAQIVARLDIESHSDTPEAKIVCQSLFNLLLVELSRGRVTDMNGLNDEEKAIAVLAYLQQHYAEINTLEDVADKAQIAPKQLTKKLKILTGMNYNHYLNYLRAAKAMQQLLYSDQSITEIAYDVGYQDSNYFSTRFKSLFRVSPRDVRAGCAAQWY